MKLLLIVVATFSAFNEDINNHERTDLLFTRTNANYLTQRYVYSFSHSPTQMNEYDFTSFKNGSEKLIYEIPTSLNVDKTRFNDFYILVDTNKFYFDEELGYLTEQYFSVDNFFAYFDYTANTIIQISIPTTSTYPIPSYAQALDNAYLYTKEAFKELFEGYQTGYSDGVDDGYYDGFNDGQNVGYDDGYDDGLIDGSEVNAELGGFFIVLGQAFTSIASILAIQLFPGFTLGLLLFIPLIFGIAYVLIKFLLGGG